MQKMGHAGQDTTVPWSRYFQVHVLPVVGNGKDNTRFRLYMPVILANYLLRYTGREHTVPILAEGTAGIEPAGEAGRAIAAKLEALAPRTQGEVGPRVKTLPQEGKRGPEPPPPRDPKGRAECVQKTPPTESECKPESQVLPQDGKHRPKALPKVARTCADVSLIGC